jgi:hypothetical protein
MEETRPAQLALIIQATYSIDEIRIHVPDSLTSRRHQGISPAPFSS